MKMKLFRKLYNYIICLRYPFYKNRNVWTGKFLGYSSTWYADIPEGWRKAFGKQFSKELKKQLKKDKQLHTFRFSEIKEKYGTLRIYTFGCSEECQKIINKYENISRNICINCGKYTEYETEGYILPLCPKHLREYEKLSNEDDITKYRMEYAEELDIDDKLKQLLNLNNKQDIIEYIYKQLHNEDMFYIYSNIRYKKFNNNKLVVTYWRDINPAIDSMYCSVNSKTGDIWVNSSIKEFEKF